MNNQDNKTIKNAGFIAGLLFSGNEDLVKRVDKSIMNTALQIFRDGKTYNGPIAIIEMNKFVEEFLNENAQV